MIIRPATSDDAPVLHEIVQRAYGGYVEQLGVRPRPLVDDYAERVREADVFVAEDDAYPYRVNTLCGSGGSALGRGGPALGRGGQG